MLILDSMKYITDQILDPRMNYIVNVYFDKNKHYVGITVFACKMTQTSVASGFGLECEIGLVSSWVPLWLLFLNIVILLKYGSKCGGFISYI